MEDWNYRIQSESEEKKMEREREKGGAPVGQLLSADKHTGRENQGGPEMNQGSFIKSRESRNQSTLIS